MGWVDCMPDWFAHTNRTGPALRWPCPVCAGSPPAMGLRPLDPRGAGAVPAP